MIIGQTVFLEEERILWEVMSGWEKQRQNTGWEEMRILSEVNSLTTKKQTTKFSSANLKKNVKSKLYHIENLKIRGQTV